MYMLIKSAVLIFSVLGYAMLYQKRRHPLCFFPITAVSGLTIAIYFAGIVNLLKPACYGMVFLGLVLLLRYFSFDRLRKIAADQSILFVALSAVWLYGVTRGAMLSHYDDGSHWYRICKAMNAENAFPTTPDIHFHGYVPGCKAT